MAHCSHTRTLGQTVIGVSIFYCRADPQRRRSLDIASTNWAPAKGLARRTLRGTPFAAQRCALSPDTYRIAQLGSFSRARRASSHPSILARPKLMSVTRARGKGLPLRRLVASSPDAALSTPYPASAKVSSSISRRRSSSSTRRIVDLSAGSWELLRCISHLSSKKGPVHEQTCHPLQRSKGRSVHLFSHPRRATSPCRRMPVWAR
jgi:hypothetical protein